MVEMVTMGFSGFESRDTMSSLDIFKMRLESLITDDSIKAAFINIEQAKENEKISLTDLLIALSVEQSSPPDSDKRVALYARNELLSNIAPIIKKAIVDHAIIISRNNNTIYNNVVIEAHDYPSEPVFVSKKDFIKWQQKENSIYISETLKQLLTDDVITESSSGISNVEKKNDRSKDLAGMARIIAQHFWRTDSETQISDMAVKVYVELQQYASPSDLPERTDTINNWIRPVAPEFASRRGRPKKNKSSV